MPPTVLSHPWEPSLHGCNVGACVVGAFVGVFVGELLGEAVGFGWAIRSSTFPTEVAASVGATVGEVVGDEVGVAVVRDEVMGAATAGAALARLRLLRVLLPFEDDLRRLLLRRRLVALRLLTQEELSTCIVEQMYHA